MRRLLRVLRAEGVVAILLYLAGSALYGQNWNEIASDSQGDGISPSLNDGKSFSWYYNRATDSLWFRVEVYDPMATTAFGVNIVLDTDGNPNNGGAWWGSNGGFRYDRLITAWVTRSGQSYVGTIGVADPAGVAAEDFGNLYRNNLQVIVDESQNSYLIGVLRSDIDTDVSMRAIAAVGSNQYWNDDIPNAGAGLIEDSGVQAGAVFNKTMIEFESVLPGESTRGSVIISPANEAGLEITTVALSEPDESLTIQTDTPLPVMLEEGDELEVTVIYAPAEPDIDIAASLQITTNDAGQPVHNVILTGSTLVQYPRLSLPAIDFGRVSVGETETASVTIYPANRAGLDIGALFVDPANGGAPDDFSLTVDQDVPLHLDEGDSVVVEVAFHPASVGTIEYALIIQLQDLDGTLRDGDWVLLSGEGTGLSPVATVSEEQFDFGEVNVGEVSEDAVLSIFPGNAAGLEITSIAFLVGGGGFEGFEFDIDGLTLPIVLNDGEKLDVRLRFAPPQAGTTYATLRFTTNALPAREIDIELSGTGVDQSSGVENAGGSSGEFLLSPVPVASSARCSLTVDFSGDLVLDVVDMRGCSTMLHQGLVHVGAHQFPVDLSGLPSGVYFLRARIDGVGVGQKRFVVQ